MVMCRTYSVFMLLSASLAAVECTRSSQESKTSLGASDSLALQESQNSNDASTVAVNASNSELTVAEGNGPIHNWAMWTSAALTLALMPDAVAAGGGAHLSRYGDYDVVPRYRYQPAHQGPKEWDRRAVNKKSVQSRGVKVQVEKKQDGVTRVYAPVGAEGSDSWTVETVNKVKKEAMRVRVKDSTKAEIIELSAINLEDKHLTATNFPAFVKAWDADAVPGPCKLILDLSYNSLGSEMVHKLLQIVKLKMKVIEEIDLRYNDPRIRGLTAITSLAKEINKVAGYNKVILTQADRELANDQNGLRRRFRLQGTR